MDIAAGFALTIYYSKDIKSKTNEYFYYRREDFLGVFAEKINKS